MWPRVLFIAQQSANSVALQHFEFPERVALLLGKEKEGVPVELLNIVDAAIEIPQFGVIRSLNVHVSASMLVWEYTRQRLIASPNASK
jgi:tRNA guanosine-2'-O-methyltransferase